MEVAVALPLQGATRVALAVSQPASERAFGRANCRAPLHLKTLGISGGGGCRATFPCDAMAMPYAQKLGARDLRKRVQSAHF